MENEAEFREYSGMPKMQSLRDLTDFMARYDLDRVCTAKQVLVFRGGEKEKPCSIASRLTHEFSVGVPVFAACAFPSR